jgi:Protein of unknown function (DUF3037)
MKIGYSFSVLRYVHDPVSHEFVNIGVAVFSEQARYLHALCTGNYGRITHLFEKIDGHRFRQLSRFLQDQINAKGSELEGGLPFEQNLSIERLLAHILPVDDSAIQFSGAGVGFSDDLDKTLKVLYERHVEHYAALGDSPRRSDEEVWKVFRDPLDRARVTSQLRPKRIVAPDYEYEFLRSWKNEIWHVYEPVSFDMQEAASILDKANRWVGRAASLNESAELFRINLLLGAPQDERLKPTYIKAQNILNKMPGKKNFIQESEAEELAENLAQELEHHNAVADK